MRLETIVVGSLVPALATRAREALVASSFQAEWHWWGEKTRAALAARVAEVGESLQVASRASLVKITQRLRTIQGSIRPSPPCPWPLDALLAGEPIQSYEKWAIALCHAVLVDTAAADAVEVLTHYADADLGLVAGLLEALSPAPDGLTPPPLSEAGLQRLLDLEVLRVVSSPDMPISRRRVRLDPRIAELLTAAARGGPAYERTLVAGAHLPAGLLADPAALLGACEASWGRDHADALVASLSADDRPVVRLDAEPGHGVASACVEACAHVQADLVHVALHRLPRDPAGFRSELVRSCREAPLRGSAIVVLDGLDEAGPGRDGRPDTTEILAIARRFEPRATVVITTGELDTPCRTVVLARPRTAEQAALWERRLQGFGLGSRVLEVAAFVAPRFDLTPRQIDVIVERAAARGLDARSTDDVRHVVAAECRRATAQGTEQVARRLSPRRRLEDLVVPESARAQLEEMVAHVVHRDVVLEGCGLQKHLVTGRAVSAVFAGPSGAGKTLGAEAIAAELGVDVLVVDIPGVLSKWVGETEKNLARVFDVADRGNAVLFFDEADALFGRRTQTKTASDRYGNVEVAYLLQRMECFDGVLILATNLLENMDAAFLRRLRFRVEFPEPSRTERRELWTRMLRLDGEWRANVDFDALARDYEITGGHIRNIVVSAAFRAARQARRTITMDDVCMAASGELRKIGRVMSGTQGRRRS